MRAALVGWALCVTALAGCGVDRRGLGDGPAVDAGPLMDAHADLGPLPPDLGPPPDDMPVPPADLPFPVDLGPPPGDLGPPTDMGCSILGCPGRRCTGGTCDLWASCAEIHAADGDTLTSPTGTYPIDPDGSGGMPSIMAFCEMSADGGGWTLVLKVDPGDATFTYTAGIWGDNTLLNATSLDYARAQAKLAAYTSVACHELRVGFLPAGGSGDGVAATYAVFDPPDKNSFKQLVMMGATPLGVASDWLGLMSGSDVQSGRRVTGVNVDAEVRVGLVANDMSSASNPDSYLGIGPKSADFAAGCPSSGNCARWNGTGGDRTLPAWAFVFVR